MAKGAPLLVLTESEGPTGASALLRQLGAEVRTMPLFGDVEEVLAADEIASVLLIEAGERPDLAASALREVRRTARLAETPVLVSLAPGQLSRLEPSSGFDDFIVSPCTPVELYARVRQLEWKRSEFSTEERTKIGDIVIDRVGHEVTVSGRRVGLTAREFSLLAFFAQNRGRVFRREALLARVWGARYEGGARTVDIHVRRLRMKVGDALPLETLRGEGYVLRAPKDLTAPPARLAVARAR